MGWLSVAATKAIGVIPEDSQSCWKGNPFNICGGPAWGTCQTKLPWKASFEREIYEVDIINSEGDSIVRVEYNNNATETEAIAKFILEACNNYEATVKQRDALLAACERHKEITVNSYGNTVWDANYSDMDAAIAAGGGKCEHFKVHEWGEPPLEPDGNGTLHREEHCTKCHGPICCGGDKEICDIEIDAATGEVQE